MKPAAGIAYCTTREAAKVLGVSLRTAQQWCERGLLKAWKTAGGHRRISRASVQGLKESATRREHGAVAPSPDVDRMKVLLVEDDRLMLKLLKTRIACWKLPLDLSTAGNGVDGLILVGRDAPDLMITDLSMPGLDGFQLIHSLAATAYRDGMEIIVVSALDPADIEARGGLPKDILILPKPVPFEELHAVFLGMLERRTAYLTG